jgi:hypothetical protein
MNEDHVTRAKEAPDFIIDEETGALLNTNARALQGYRVKRAQMRQQQLDRERLDRLESRFDRIEQLLLKVLEK